jgi:hypothetical protein
MAHHQNAWSLAQEAIPEYLTAARLCLDQRKSDGGCLGYPGVLLLLCLVDAMGTYLRHQPVPLDGKTDSIKGGEPFRVLNHALFAQALTETQIKMVEARYRNPLAHDAMIATDSWLLPGKGTSVFVFDQQTVAVYVESLYDLVLTAWTKFDKSKIKVAVDKQFVKPNR